MDTPKVCELLSSPYKSFYDLYVQHLSYYFPLLSPKCIIDICTVGMPQREIVKWIMNHWQANAKEHMFLFAFISLPDK